MGFFLLSFTLLSMGQSTRQIDEVVGKIYNNDFVNIKNQLIEIEKTEPQIADYLRFDILWWKMISSNSDADESEFLSYKNTFIKDNDRDYKDFKKLVYFLYQIRYENFKKTGFSKYLTALKCEVCLQKLDEKKCSVLKPNELIILQLIVQFDKCLRSKYLSDLGLFKERNEREFYASLSKIENLKNIEFESFETIKNYFLGKIYLEIAHDSIKGLEKFSKLSEDYPGNVVFKKIKNKSR